jgi:integrase/recombinase XerC
MLKDRLLKDRFITFIEVEKRYSPHTLLAYRQDLDQFSSFASLNYSINSIELADHQVIRSWFVSLIEGGVTPRTITRKMSTLKSFFRFAKVNGFSGPNPMLKVTAPKVAKRLPVYIEEEKMGKLITFPQSGDKLMALRNEAIFLVFYATGIRLSELIGIRYIDIDLVSGSIRVTGKRSKERIVPIGVLVIETIKRYIELLSKSTIPANKSSYLFVTDQGKQLYPKLVYRCVHAWLALVSTNEKLSPHVLRHTFATHMLNNGADLNTIKEILGHSSLAATQVYTHNSITKLKSVYKQAHPRA